MPEASASANIYTAQDYYALPEHVRAELIDGQFYYMSAPGRIHQEILNFILTEINIYIRSRKSSCKVYPAPFSVKLFQSDDKTVVEPDISVICDPNKLTDRGCTGAPDWITEIISPSTSSHDYIRKLNLYAKAGVKEYWIIDPRNEKIFIYHLEQADVKTDSYNFHDRVKPGLFDDLWIDFTELKLQI